MYSQIFWPIILHLFRFFNSLYLSFKYRHSHLRIGYNSHITHSDFGQYVTIGNKVVATQATFGNYTYIGDNSIICRCHIGNFCSLSSSVHISPGRHPTDFISTHPSFYSTDKPAQVTFVNQEHFPLGKTPAEIGNDVWIGANATIMDGIKVGNGAIIAASAIVTHNVPDFAIVGGIPAKIIRYRFTPKQIKFISQTKWWAKDISWYRQHSDKFQNFDDFKNIFSHEHSLHQQ